MLRISVPLLVLVLQPGCDPPSTRGTTTPSTSTTHSASQPTAVTSATTSAATSAGSAEPWRKQHIAYLASASARASNSAPTPAEPPAADAAGLGADLAVWHPTEPRLAFAQGKSLTIIDLRRPGTRVTFDPAAGPITDLIWASQAPVIATSSSSIQVWSTTGGAPQQTIPAQASDTMVLSHDGRYLAINDGPQVWKVADGAKLPPFEEPGTTGLWGLAFASDNRHLAATNPGGVILWNLSSGKRVHERMFETGATSPLVVSPDGGFLAVSEQMHKLLAYRLSDATVTHLETVSDCVDHLSGLRFAKNGRTLRVQASSGWWRCWNVPTLSPRSSFKPDQDVVESWMSDDCATVIVKRQDDVVEVWDAFKSRKRATLDGGVGGSQVESSSGGRYAAVAGGLLAVWDLADGKRIEL